MKLNSMNMRHYILIALLVAILPNRIANAQSEKALLWKIDGNGLTAPSYIYGTVHIICESDFTFGASITNALNDTQQTILELDYDDPQMMTKIQQGMMNEGMKSIVNEYTPEQQEIVNKFFKTHYEMDLNMLGVIKPFGLTAMVLQKSITCEDNVKSYEQAFTADAKDRNVELLGLESFEFQTSLFDDVPMEDQIELLVTSIVDFEDDKEDFKKMISAYKAKDLIKLKELMTETRKYQKFENLLVDDRNKDWIAKIAAHAKEKPTFFAVGALHLPGEVGVLNLLKEAGFEVTPVF